MQSGCRRRSKSSDEDEQRKIEERRAGQGSRDDAGLRRCKPRTRIQMTVVLGSMRTVAAAL